MIDALNFVKGAIPKSKTEKNYVRIHSERVTAFDGTVAISSPIPLNVNCSPIGKPLVDVVKSWKKGTTPTFKLSEDSLNVSFDGLESTIPCIPDGQTFGPIVPSGESYEIDGVSLIEDLKIVKPFVRKTPIPAHKWANGVLLDNAHCYATNNTSVVKIKLQKTFPLKCNIPLVAVRELLRFKIPPTHIQFCGKTLTFHYDGGRWLKVILYGSDEFNLSKADCVLTEGLGGYDDLDTEFFTKLTTIESYCSKSKLVYFNKSKMMSAVNDLTTDPESILAIDVENNIEGAYPILDLKLFKGKVSKIGVSAHCDAILFKSEKLLGAVIRI